MLVKTLRYWANVHAKHGWYTDTISNHWCPYCVPRIRKLLHFSSSSKSKAANPKQLRLILQGSPLYSYCSALSNMGPCMTSAICYVAGPQSQPVVVKEPFSRYSKSYNGELRVLLLATKFVRDLTINHSLMTWTSTQTAKLLKQNSPIISCNLWWVSEHCLPHKGQTH